MLFPDNNTPFYIMESKSVVNALNAIGAALKTLDGGKDSGIEKSASAMSFEGFDTYGFKENLKKMDGQGGWKISEEEEKFAGTGHYEERLISGRTQKTARILRKSGEPFTVDDKLPLEASCHIRSIHDVDMGRQTFTVR